MDQQQLKEHLEQLTDAIDGLKAPDEDKQQLVKLIADIELQLATPLVEGEPQNLADQVDAMVSTFEADHPTVSGILKNIMLTLSNMGV